MKYRPWNFTDFTLAAKISLFLPLILIVAAVPLIQAQTINHWETIIKSGDNCNYFIPSTDIGMTWPGNGFNDSNWKTGISGIGIGDNDDKTILSTGISSVYIRYTFSVKDLSQISCLLLDADYDDGFIAYLNGKEIARGNIKDPVSWNMILTTTHEAKMYNGGNPERHIVKGAVNELLVEGQNILAVEVHNDTPTSSDLSSNVFLHAGITIPGTVFSSVPSWFWNSTIFTSTKLPLMIINTNGQTIPDEPRIVADMGLIDNGEGKLNSVFDSWNQYSGKISMEARGESSQGFPKKSYSIELENNDGSSNNVSILGLPEENDFVLYAPYSDKTMIKNVLSFELYRRSGHWAPRTRYVELMINDDYKGIYVLTEKIKRDENRVDIDKLTSEDTSLPGLSGGYLMRRDKITRLDKNEYWKSPVTQPYFEPLTYQYFDPEFKDLTPDQANYIKAWMQDFDQMMSGNNFKDPETGYKKYIKVNSFIDMMFLNEISKSVDAYMFSTYFYKENDADGGQLFAGPPWDCDLSFGNLNYGQDNFMPYTYNFVYDNWSRVYWWKRLMEDELYKNKVYCRWTKFRETIFRDENMENIIDSCIDKMGEEAINRNFIKYPILGKYVWPNAFYPKTYPEEIQRLKDWLFDRLAWIDNQWFNAGNCTDPGTDTQSMELAQNTFVKVFPNPSDFSQLYFEVQLSKSVSKLTVDICDVRGRVIQQKIAGPLHSGVHVIQFCNLSYLSPGIYIYNIYGPNGTIERGKVIRK